MVGIHGNMTCEDRLKFWKESSKYWSRECVRLEEEIVELMEEVKT